MPRRQPVLDDETQPEAPDTPAEDDAAEVRPLAEEEPEAPDTPAEDDAAEVRPLVEEAPEAPDGEEDEDSVDQEDEDATPPVVEDKAVKEETNEMGKIWKMSKTWHKLTIIGGALVLGYLIALNLDTPEERADLFDAFTFGGDV